MTEEIYYFLYFWWQYNNPKVLYFIATALCAVIDYITVIETGPFQSKFIKLQIRL